MPDILIFKGRERAIVLGRTPRGILWLERLVQPNAAGEFYVPNDDAQDFANSLKKYELDIEIE